VTEEGIVVVEWIEILTKEELQGIQLKATGIKIINVQNILLVFVQHVQSQVQVAAVEVQDLEAEVEIVVPQRRLKDLQNWRDKDDKKSLSLN